VNAVDEHLATRLYEFSGEPSLQALQSRNLAGLVPGQIVYTLLLNDDGSVFNDATVWNLGEDRWWLFTGRPSDFGWIRARADVRDRCGEHAILALQGPRSGGILARLVGEETVRNLQYFRFVQANEMVVARLGYSGELGYELLVPAGEERKLRGALLDAGRNEQLVECSFEAANTLRIECGYVLFDREIDGRANPLELGLERLVSPPRRFRQSRRLAGLEISGAAPREGAAAAQVTSECLSPTLGSRIALGFVAANAGAGDLVRLADGRAARIASLPFFDRERKRPRGAPL